MKTFSLDTSNLGEPDQDPPACQGGCGHEATCCQCHGEHKEPTAEERKLISTIVELSHENGILHGRLLNLELIASSERATCDELKEVTERMIISLKDNARAFHSLNCEEFDDIIDAYEACDCHLIEDRLIAEAEKLINREGK